VSKVVAAFEGFFSAAYGIQETSFLVEISRNDLLDQLIRLLPLFDGGLVELGFEFGSKVHLHGLRVREICAHCN